MKHTFLTDGNREFNTPVGLQNPLVYLHVSLLQPMEYVLPLYLTNQQIRIKRRRFVGVSTNLFECLWHYYLTKSDVEGHCGDIRAPTFNYEQTTCMELSNREKKSVIYFQFANWHSFCDIFYFHRLNTSRAANDHSNPSRSEYAHRSDEPHPRMHAAAFLVFLISEKTGTRLVA